MALKQAMPEAQVTGVDLSSEAMSVAAENARTYGLNIHWQQGDFTLAHLFLTGKADVIVSNPPYIAPCDQQELAPELQHEPHLALYCPISKPPLYYHSLIVRWLPLLKPNGVMGIELGHHTATALDRLLNCDARLQGCFWRFVPDFQGIQRHLLLVKGNSPQVQA
jgi:release factor glutamine methyltransferase